MTAGQDYTEDAAPNAAETPATSGGAGRILVGVDGSAGSVAALEWAVRETRLRGGVLHVVMAWQRPASIGSANVWGMGMDPTLYNPSLVARATADEASRLGAEATQGQEVLVTSEAVEGHPAAVLVEVAENADLLVVGTRGHGGFVGALLGSVSQHVVTHARCPVVVIPAARHSTHGGHDVEGQSYLGGVFGQAHEHYESAHGQGVYEQGHPEPAGQGVYDQGRQEPGEGVYEQARPHPEDA